MDKDRLLAFSDAMLAIIITVMVLALPDPHADDWAALITIWPAFISYALSFLIVGLYWYYHHRLFFWVTIVNTPVIFFNMIGLFWDALLPFSARWIGVRNFSPATVTLYALVNALVTASFIFLIRELRKVHGIDSEFSKRTKGMFKIYFTLALNIAAALIATIGLPRYGFVVMIVAVGIWIIPSKREKEAKKLPPVSKI